MIDRAKKLLSRRFRFRSAVTGQFVTRAYALLHPRTTYGVQVR